MKINNKKIPSTFFLIIEKNRNFYAKPDKLVTLISSLHDDNIIDETNKKPIIIMNYNETKGGVDNFDQMCQNMNAGRKTQRWPLCIFYNMINIASINAYVIYLHNFCKNNTSGSKPLSRFQFMIRLREQLCEDWMRSRLSIPTLPTNLKKHIEDSLEVKDTVQLQSQEQKRKHQSTKEKFALIVTIKKGE